MSLIGVCFRREGCGGDSHTCIVHVDSRDGRGMYVNMKGTEYGCVRVSCFRRREGRVLLFL